MAISRFSTSRLTLGLPKSQSAWDQDAVEQGAIVPIATITTTTNTAFQNIPQTYQDLRLVISASITTAGSYPFISLNNASTTSSHTRLGGAGATATSERRTGDGVWYWGGLPFSPTATIPGSLTLDILNYKGATFKTGISRWVHDLNGSGETHLTSHLNQTTSPITRIDFGSNPGPFSFFSATLYGIKAGA